MSFHRSLLGSIELPDPVDGRPVRGRPDGVRVVRPPRRGLRGERS